MKTQFLIPLLVSGLAHAQVYTPPAAQSAHAQGVPTDTVTKSEKTEPAPSPLGNEIPMLDPAAETITVGGVSMPIANTRLLKARFEKYLNQPPENSEAASRYRATIREILAAISPNREGEKGKDGRVVGPSITTAFKLLPKASTYEGDANICSSLAESIYKAMLAKNDIRGLTVLNQALNAEKHDLIDKSDYIASFDTGEDMHQAHSVKEEKKKGPGKQPGKGLTSLEYVDNVRRIAEIEALKKINVAKTDAQTLQIKLQYQASMVQWFVERRYEHVLMAARFYTQIWRDGDSNLHIKKDSDVSKLFSDTFGVSPTVTSLDSFSNEAIKETSSYVDSFNFLLEHKQLHSATQRLMEAFALGEFLTPVATLSYEKKQKIAGYFKSLNELYVTLQFHDYDKARTLAKDLSATAIDFPASMVDGLIAANTMASNLAINEAKAHLLSKENDLAAKKIKEATQLWPLNPKLKEFETMVDGASVLVTTRNDFKRLFSEKNYREILKREYEIAPAIKDDPDLVEKFTQIKTNLVKIEMALGKAAEFSKMGQNYAAWEQLAQLREQFPDDPKLGHELESLAPKVADFTLALDKAKQFENRNPPQVGSALAWYLKARNIYPQSSMADSGTKRLIGDILTPDDSVPAASNAK
jgi:hypothetical protein